MKYILASGSPRRQALLKQIDMEFEVITADVDESYKDGTAPDEIVAILSRRKGLAVYERIKDSLKDETVIISADTLVALDNKVLGKPKDEDEAFEMLSALSGRSHFVYTGVTLIYHSKNGIKDMTFTDGAEVFFRDLDENEIKDYIATGEPMDKAGAYGIQERGAVLAEKIHGDFYTIVGLPIVRVVTGIRELTK
ncbi:MAG: septum formation protein Maf [Firmicutes bacterium]|nr:septum formation protein Maf [Bacillota bacterium]